MDFKARQIWKSEKQKATITVYKVENGKVSFKIEAGNFEQYTEWFENVFNIFLIDHGFELVKNLEAKKYCLVGVDGNAYAVMGYVRKAMKESGFDEQEIKSYLDDAMSSDYDHLLAVSVEMVDKCNERVAD